MKKKHIRTVVDMAMIVLLPMLMAYSLIGEKLHEIIGTILFALFIQQTFHQSGLLSRAFHEVKNPTPSITNMKGIPR